MQEAINKLSTEMEANKANPYIQFVGDFLIKHVEQNPQDAEKIMIEDKTLGKSLDDMRKVAEKKKVGNVAMLTPDEGFKVVLEYFGIKGDSFAVPVATAPAAEPKTDSDFDVNLDDLLSGV
jgi:hypothetical protein